MKEKGVRMPGCKKFAKKDKGDNWIFITIGLCLFFLLLLLFLLSGIPQTLMQSRGDQDIRAQKLGEVEEVEEGYLLTAESLPKVATRLLKGLFKGFVD